MKKIWKVVDWADWLVSSPNIGWLGGQKKYMTEKQKFTVLWMHKKCMEAATLMIEIVQVVRKVPCIENAKKGKIEKKNDINKISDNVENFLLKILCQMKIFLESKRGYGKAAHFTSS